MSSKQCMINVMADIIGLDEQYQGEKLNDDAVWKSFMDEVFKRMDTVEDDQIRAVLNSINAKEFQQWIDDKAFWMEIENEIIRRGQYLKTLLPSEHEGHC